MIVQVAGSVGPLQRPLQRDEPGKLPEVSPALAQLLEARGEAGLLPRPVHLQIDIDVEDVLAHRCVHQLQRLHDRGQSIVVRRVQRLEGKLVIGLNRK